MFCFKRELFLSLDPNTDAFQCCTVELFHDDLRPELDDVSSVTEQACKQRHAES